MYQFEGYAITWAKQEKVEQDTPLEQFEAIRSLMKQGIHKLKNCVIILPKSVFIDTEAVKHLKSLHDKYVIVPEDKASTNIFGYNYLNNSTYKNVS